MNLPATAYIDTNGFNAGISHALAGDGGLTKIGLGTLTLSGVNTYLGATTIQAGTLAIDRANELGASNQLNFTGNGTLQSATNLSPLVFWTPVDAPDAPDASDGGFYEARDRLPWHYGSRQLKLASRTTISVQALILHAVYFITCVLGNTWKFQVSNEARAAAWL